MQRCRRVTRRDAPTWARAQQRRFYKDNDSGCLRKHNFRFGNNERNICFIGIRDPERVGKTYLFNFETFFFPGFKIKTGRENIPPGLETLPIFAPGRENIPLIFETAPLRQKPFLQRLDFDVFLVVLKPKGMFPRPTRVGKTYFWVLKLYPRVLKLYLSNYVCIPPTTKIETPRFIKSRRTAKMVT